MIQLTPQEQAFIREIQEALRQRLSDRVGGILAARGLQGSYTITEDGTTLLSAEEVQKLREGQQP